MHWSTRRALDAVAKKGHDRLDADLLDALSRDEATPTAVEGLPHVDANGSCPELVNAKNPCPKHGRPLNAHWSSDRDRRAQQWFRDAVLQRDGYRCTRCPSTGPLVAHHVRPGYDVSAGITLCESCHQEVDAHAR
jgi:hypothetical protein